MWSPIVETMTTPLQVDTKDDADTIFQASTSPHPWHASHERLPRIGTDESRTSPSAIANTACHVVTRFGPPRGGHHQRAVGAPDEVGAESAPVESSSVGVADDAVALGLGV